MRSLAAALAFFFLAGLCLPPQAKGAERPLKFWFWSLPDTLDPHRADEFALMPLAKNIYATLVSTYMDSGVQGLAAESWTVSRDGLTWRFKVRKGITFQDGSPVTAQAVLANLRRILWLTRATSLALNALLPEVKAWQDYSAPLRTLYAEKGEVVFVFSKRPQNLFEVLSQTLYGIADPKCFDEKGAWKTPFCAGGSGEYHLSDRAPEMFTLKARNLYPRADKAPATVQIAVPSRENPSVTKSMMDGDGDLALRRSLDLDAELEGMLRSAGIKYARLPAFQMNFVRLNWARAPFSDKQLRQSFRDIFLGLLSANRLFSDDAEVDPSFIPKGGIGYKKIPVPKRAQALKTYAGRKIVAMLSRETTVNPLRKKRIAGALVRQTVLDALAAHGLEVEIITEAAENQKRQKSGDYDLFMMGSGVSIDNPFESLRMMFMSDVGARLPDLSGKIGPLIEAAEVSADPAARRRLAEELNGAVFDDAAAVTYAHSGLVLFYKPGLDLSRCSLFLEPIEFRAVNWTPAAR